MEYLKYSYIGKNKKRNFRQFWITKINAGAKMCGTTYSKLMSNLKKSNVTINRKMF